MLLSQEKTMGFKVEEKFRIILVMKEVNLTNGLAMCSSGIRSINFQNTTNDDSRTNVQFTTAPPLA